MSKFLACAVLLIFSVFSVGSVNAQNIFVVPKVEQSLVDEAILNLSQVRFTPDNPLYYFIRIKEAFTHFFKKSAVKKAEYDLILTGKRLREIQGLIEKDKLDKVPASFELYSDLSGRLRGEIERARSQNQDVADLIGLLKSGLVYQEVIFSDIYYSMDSKGRSQVEHSYSSAYLSLEESARYLDSLVPGSLMEFKGFNDTEDSEILKMDESIESTRTPQFPLASPFKIIR